MEEQPAGWHPFGDSGEVRWWDGEKWDSGSQSRASSASSAAKSFASQRDRGVEFNPSGWAIFGAIVLFILIFVVVFVVVAAATL
jgi:hypothetical protein